MKKNIILFVIFILISLNLYSYNLDFGTFDVYNKSNYKSGKWNMLVKKAYKDIAENSFGEASTNFKKAIDKGCVSPQVYQDLSLVYIQLSNYDDASIYIDKTKNSEFMKAAYKDIADTLYSNKKYDEAGKYYEKGKMRNEGYTKIGDTFLNEKNYKMAAKYYSKTDNPKEGYLKIAENNLRNENYNIAEEYYAQTDNPKDGYEKIAETALNKKDYNNAEIYFLKSGKQQSGLLKIADSYFTDKDYTNAYKFYNKAELSKKEMQNLANKFLEAKEYDMSLKFYQTANMGNEGKIKIADYCLSIKDFTTAIKYYEQSEMTKDGYIRTADSLFNAKQYDQAVKFWVKGNVIEKRLEEKTKGEDTSTKIMLYKYLLDYYDNESSQEKAKEYDIKIAKLYIRDQKITDALKYYKYAGFDIQKGYIEIAQYCFIVAEEYYSKTFNKKIKKKEKNLYYSKTKEFYEAAADVYELAGDETFSELFSRKAKQVDTLIK